jgi:16S rRNA (adenine1518-N6/adenine1519-N6)-dimethyltransferase
VYDHLLGAGEIRRLAEEIGVKPTKTLGQNFVHDANTVRRIVDASGVGPADHVLEVGPGLGSLTLALVQAAGAVTAVEIDPRLAERLPVTVAEHLGEAAARLRVLGADALRLEHDAVPGASVPGQEGQVPPSAVVANLPYNVSVPVILHLLQTFPSIESMLVMVQAEVADRLVAAPGSRTYGAPSVKLSWYGTARRAGSVSRSIFWPVPGVDSALVAWTRRPLTHSGIDARSVFAVVDAAFSQRRKTLRSALARWAGSPAAAEAICRAAGVDPAARGESLAVGPFVALATAGAALRAGGGAGSSAHPVDDAILGHGGAS